MNAPADMPLMVVLAGFGWASARVLLDGLATGSASWLFPVLACVSGFWALVRPFTEGDAYALPRHVGAMALAALLLHVPVRVELGALGNAPGGGYTAVDPGKGAAPLPTWLVDRIGSALETSVRQMLIGSDRQVLPMLSDALRDAAADRSAFQDDQVAVNVASWRTLAGSLLAADRRLAAAIDAEGLGDRLLSPAMTQAAWSGAEAVRAQRVVELLAQAQTSPGEIVCRNSASLAELAARLGGAVWTTAADCMGAAASAGALSFSPVSQYTRQALQKVPSATDGADPQAASQRSRGSEVLGNLAQAGRSDIDASRFALWADAYRAVAAGTIVGAAAQLGTDDTYRRLLGSHCIARGNDRCGTVFAVASDAMSLHVRERLARVEPGFLERAGQWITGREPGTGPLAFPAASIGMVVSLFVKLFAQLVAALTPYALAVSRGLAVIMSIAGIYLLLVPGRTRDAMAWMVGPMVWVHLWAILFFIWYPLETVATDALAALPIGEPADAALSSQAVMRFVFAAGYASLPFLAWKLTFGGLARSMPKMGLDRMVAPARNFVANQVRRLGPRSSQAARTTTRAVRSTAAALPANRRSAGIARSGRAGPSGSAGNTGGGIQ